MGKNDRKSKDPKRSGKFLDHGTIVLNTINQKMRIHNTIYTWRVPKYSTLKRNVMYYQVFESADVKCVFKLFKTNSMLYLCLRSGQVIDKKAHFYVMSETQQTSLNVEAKEIRDGLYSGEFKYELFEDPKLQFLADDILTVSFRYVSGLERDYLENAFDGLDTFSELDGLCCDLKSMYLESMYPDFEIKVKDYVFKAHKFILSARCEFFNRYFDKNPDAKEFTVDTVPGILHEVLLFVYCGELKEMDLTCMMRVLDLADDLKILSLVEKCSEYFEARVDENNFEEFHSFQQEKQYPELNQVLEKVSVKMRAR